MLSLSVNSQQVSAEGGGPRATRVGTSAGHGFTYFLGFVLHIIKIVQSMTSGGVHRMGLKNFVDRRKTERKDEQALEDRAAK